MSVEKNQNVLITKAARKKLVRARAGAAVLPKISGMAFGDGGVGDDGSVLAPAEGASALRHELYRKNVDGYSFVGETACRYECTLSGAELAGEDINEIGLFDEDGDIVCIKSFKNKGKDEGLEMTFQIEDEF